MAEKTMADVEELNRRRGKHWFEPDTLAFFKSSYGGLYGNRYFISSEKSPYDKRKWSIRKVDWKTGKIGTVGDFQQFGTEAQAKRHMKDVLKLKDVVV